MLDSEKKPEKKPVIMQILPKLNSGGVERGAVDIAKAITKAGFTSIVVSGGGKMVYALKEAGVKHVTLPVNSKNPFVIYRNIKKLIKLITENEVDIVHVRSRAPAWSAYYACQKTGCKLVTTVHGVYSTGLFKRKNSTLKKAYNSIMVKGNFVIAVSNFIKNYIIENYAKEIVKIPEENLVVIHRGVDLNYFAAEKVSKSRLIELANSWNLPDDKKIIMLPARITSWKGHEFLIQALAMVKNEDFFCIMVGSDKGHKEYRKRLEKKIEKENLAGKVRIMGDTKDMPAAYVLSHLVISSSIRPEAFGRIAIEAASMGRIVIATKIGGSLETIIDGKTGFLVSETEPYEMAEKIDYILSLDKAKQDEIAANAKKHIAENFSNQKMYKETIALYKKILN